jgi:dipeptide transport system ATP-binding protein
MPQPLGNSMKLLEVRNLRVSFGGFVAVDGVDFDAAEGELLGIVGESGSGKSVSMMAVMGLIDQAGQVSADVLRFDGHDLLKLNAAQRRRLVGKDIAMVFQDALNSLNPSHTVGDQVREVLRVHLGLRGAALEARVLELFERVEIPAPKTRLAAFPHQLSGGMNQRVMIAMAIACQPRLLIADEPTTALDVTIQAQVMALLMKLQKEQGMSLILITHDLAVVSEMAAQSPHQVAVMYAGQVVETGTVPGLFEHPRHPYTAALLAALPEHNPGARRLNALPGVVPGRLDRPAGCLLQPRCAHAQAKCGQERPLLHAGVRCFYPLGAA